MNHTNKRGFLLASETVKIVIAVICIVFLVYFLTALYFSNIKETKQREAVESLNSRLKPGIIDSQSKGIQPITFANPIGWYFFTFTGAESIPNSCGGENCACICDNVWRFGVSSLYGKSERTRQAEECDESGACLSILELVDEYVEKEITQTNGLTISSEYKDGKIILK